MRSLLFSSSSNRAFFHQPGESVVCGFSFSFVASSSAFTASARNGPGLYTLAKGVSSVSMVGAGTPRGVDYTLQAFVASSASFAVCFDARLHLLCLLTLLNTRHPSSTWLPGPYCSDFATPDNHFIFSQSHNKRELDLHCKIAPLALRASTVLSHFNPANPSRQHLRLRSHLPPALSTTTCASTTTTEQYCSLQSWGKHSLAGGHYGRSLCLYVH